MYARHQAALAALTQSVLANTEQPALLQEATLLVARTLAVPFSAIWEALPDQSALVLRAAAGWQSGAVEHAAVAAATSPAGFTLHGTSPLIVEDWPNETRFTLPALLRSAGVISSVYVAIPAQARPMGSLSVDVAASRTFCDEEICFLQAVANVLALALERMETHQTLEREENERAHLLEDRQVAAQQHAVWEERQRLARDLHDSVTQALYGITLHAQAAQRLLAANNVASVAESLHALQNTAQEALDEMRLLIFELRPPVLEQGGLVAALQARLNAVEGRANLETRLVADGVGDLPLRAEHALYRIAQEALNNVLKHAHARRITVRLQQTQRGIMLDVTDDGVGFEPAAAGETGGLGLRGMAERVAQLGGLLTVHSAAGSGTQVRVEIAL